MGDSLTRAKIYSFKGIDKNIESIFSIIWRNDIIIVSITLYFQRILIFLKIMGLEKIKALRARLN
jgi:hypothetical protein